MKRDRAESSRHPAAKAGAARQAEVPPAPGTPAPWRRPLLWIIPSLAALVSYLVALHNGFVWDDPLVLQQLRAIHRLSDLIFVPVAIPRLYYRPVIFASYLFDLSLGGEQPFWFHFSVVAWHVFNTALVFAVARRLLPKEQETFAAVAALLFAIHPIHVESVSWMAGRSDVIACGFLLLAVLLYQTAGAASAWVAAGAMLLAVLAKESVVLAGALFPVLDWSMQRRLDWRRYMPMGIALFVYLFLRVVGVGLIGGPLPPGWESPARLVFAVGFYLGKVVLPVSQTVYANDVPQTAAYFVLGMLGIVGFVAALVWAWVRRQTVVLFCLAWFAITLAPALVLVLRRIATAPVAERYLYIPSVGAMILLSYGLGILVRRSGFRRLVLGAVAIAAIAGGVDIQWRNRVWSNEIRFWTAAAAESPNAMPERELADAYLRHGKVPQAEKAYLVALKRWDTPEERAMTYANLGNLYRRLDQVDKAIDMFKQGLSIAEHPSIYHGLGFAWMRKAELEQQAHNMPGVVHAVEEARTAFENALRLGSLPNAATIYRGWDPAKTHLLLGQVLFSLGERDEARRHLEEAIRLEPHGLVADTARKFLARLGDGG